MGAWPSSDPGRLGREEEALCLAARVEPGPAALRRLTELLSGHPDWERLWRLAHVHEVAPLVSQTIGGLEASVAVPSAWRLRAQRRMTATLIQNEAARTQLERVLGAMESVGLPVMPVKGLVVAGLYYGSTALRPARDIDILVPPDEIGAARGVLRGLGFRRPEVGQRLDGRDAFEDPPWFLGQPPAEICLELHWGLWSARAYGLRPDSLWERSRVVPIFGRPTRVLGLEDTLLHLAIHRARSSLRLRWLCDVAELLRAEGAALDPDDLEERATAAGARTALAMALELAEGLLGAPLPPGLAGRPGLGRARYWILDRTCGRRALFPAGGIEDEQRQPHISTRVLEQDGALHVGRTLAWAVIDRSLHRAHAGPG